MRELFGVELRGTDDSDNAAVWPLIEQWAQRHVPTEPSKTQAIHAELTTEQAPSGARSLSLLQPDDTDKSLMWRSDVALGAPGEPLHAIVRIRLVAKEGAALEPLQYEFGSPTIVRTILREYEVFDAGELVSPTPIELGHSSVESLVAFLREPARRLPVLVITRVQDSGDTLVDERTLAAQLAGIAHVRVLSSSYAAWRLTEELGRFHSVWGGGVRVYFPRFSLDDAPRFHRLYHPDRVDESLVRRLRSWLSSLSSSRTPEHPVFTELREDRRKRLREAKESDDVELFMGYAEELEAKNEDQAVQILELQRRETQLQSDYETLEDELEALKRDWAQYGKSLEVDKSLTAGRAATSDDVDIDGPTSMKEAFAWVEQLASSAWYRSRMMITPQAERSMRSFSDYRRPDEFVRAMQAVLEAGALYHDGKLGEPPAMFFSRRGYGYGAQPQPHLKVDEATSPDQCLRIYWEEDTDTRLWKVTHIGRHE
ncbi:MAG: hypothetical protein M3O70_05760 [Actinomycetota bacterium]|nr:hypothetical protein [Actinomycetota bacterium]